MSLFGKNEVSDKELSKTVNSRISRAGAGSRITATVNRGVVTIMGKLQYAAQRNNIKNTATQISGVKHVIDQMKDPEKKPIAPPPHAPPQQNAAPQAI